MPARSTSPILDIYPDQIADWHNQNIKNNRTNTKLSKAWLRIEAIMIARPELMQNVIKQQIDSFERTIFERYPRTTMEEAKITKARKTIRLRLPKPHPYLITDDNDADTRQTFEPNPERNDVLVTDPVNQPRERTRKFTCQGHVCSMERARGEIVNRKVATINANCETCRVFNNAAKRAELIEDLLLESSSTRKALAKRITGTHKSENLTTLRDWAHQTASDNVLWPKLSKRDIDNNTTQNKYQTRALRMIAKTLSIPVQGLCQGH